jgi:hypothetical protein
VFRGLAALTARRHAREQIRILWLRFRDRATGASRLRYSWRCSASAAFALSDHPQRAAVFICGLVTALGNRVSTGLPCSFILISAAMLPKILLDVPLTTVLLTYSGALLFLLWYVMPRTIFEQGAGPKSATG